MLFSDVEILCINESIYIKGLPAKTLLKDLVRIYKYNSNEGEEFFKIVVSGFLVQRATIRFHRYFSLEVYALFCRLFMITERVMYKDAADGLADNDSTLKKYLTPPIDIPSSIENKLNELSITLFPYQKQFLNILYNSKEKLGLRGNICSFGTGMGKTLGVLGSIYALGATPCIVTAPKSTLDSSWKQSIIKFIPNIKKEEVQLITEINPKVPWKFLITNYERLSQAGQYAKFAAGPIQSLIIDECHNFRYVNTIRSQRVFELVESLGIDTIIPISGTPIKARASELLPMVKLLDPNMTDDVIKIFKKMYGKDRYSPIVESVLTKRLSIYIDREVLDVKNSAGFPTVEKYNVICTISNPDKYYISNIKKELTDSINKSVPIYAKQQKPNFIKLQQLLKQIPSEKLADDIKTEYVRLVQIKMFSPMSNEGKTAMPQIRDYETEIKKADSQIGKEIVVARKMCTSWLQMLIGKQMGIYFVKRRIECLNAMVNENCEALSKILEEAELKSIVFSNYVGPLENIISSMKKYKLNGLLVTGGTNTNALLNQFYVDNTLDFVAGTIGSIGTGTDGMQKHCSTMMITDVPYRSTDLTQAEARIYRRGAQSKVVKFYYLKLDSEEKNLVDNAQEILDWSKQMFDSAMNLDGNNLQGSIQESKSLEELTNLFLQVL